MNYTPEYIENFNDKYFLRLKIDDKIYNIYYGPLKAILFFTSSFKSMAHLKNYILKMMNITNDEEKKQISSIDLYMKKDRTKTSVLVSFDETDLLYVTSADLHKRIISNRLLDDLKFTEFLCELFEENYKEKIKEKYHAGKRSTKIDVIREMIGDKPGISFEEAIKNDDDVSYEMVRKICQSKTKKAKLIEKVKEKLNVNDNLLDDDVVYTRSRKLNNSLMFVDEEDQNVYLKNYLCSVIFDQVFRHFDEKLKVEIRRKEEELKRLRQRKNEDLYNYNRMMQLKEYEEDNYEDYLLQEGIPVNNNGEPLFDQEYDLENKSK